MARTEDLTFGLKVTRAFSVNGLDILGSTTSVGALRFQLRTPSNGELQASLFTVRDVLAVELASGVLYFGTSRSNLFGQDSFTYAVTAGTYYDISFVVPRGESSVRIFINGFLVGVIEGVSNLQDFTFGIPSGSELFLLSLWDSTHQLTDQMMETMYTLRGLNSNGSPISMDVATNGKICSYEATNFLSEEGGIVWYPIFPSTTKLDVSPIKIGSSGNLLSRTFTVTDTAWASLGGGAVFRLYTASFMGSQVCFGGVVFPEAVGSYPAETKMLTFTSVPVSTRGGRIPDSMDDIVSVVVMESVVEYGEPTGVELKIGDAPASGWYNVSPTSVATLDKRGLRQQLNSNGSITDVPADALIITSESWEYVPNSGNKQTFINVPSKGTVTSLRTKVGTLYYYYTVNDVRGVASAVVWQAPNEIISEVDNSNKVPSDVVVTATGGRIPYNGGSFAREDVKFSYSITWTGTVDVERTYTSGATQTVKEDSTFTDNDAGGKVDITPTHYKQGYNLYKTEFFVGAFTVKVTATGTDGSVKVGTARAEVYQDGNPYASTFSTAYIFRNSGTTYNIAIGSQLTGEIPDAELSKEGVSLSTGGSSMVPGGMIGGMIARTLAVGATMVEVSSIELGGDYSVTFVDTNGSSIPSHTAFYRILAVTDDIDTLLENSTLINLYGNDGYRYRAAAYTDDIYVGDRFNAEYNEIPINTTLSFNQSFKFEDVKTIIIYIEVR